MLQNGLRIARVAAVLVVLCVSGLTGAQPETFIPTDPGLEAASALVTEIGITEYSPYDDINVTVDWAYADGHRIIVVWTIEHDNQLSYDTPVPALTGENGLSFPLILHEYNRGGYCWRLGGSNILRQHEHLRCVWHYWRAGNACADRWLYF